MKFLYFLTIILALGLSTSCSSKKSSSDNTDLEEVSDDLLDDDLGGNDDLSLDDSDLSLDDESDLGDDDLALDDSNTDDLVEDLGDDLSEGLEDDGQFSANQVVDAAPVSVNTSGGTSTYTVKAGETLMWIAWSLYGDYSKWKQLSKLNGGSRVRAGQQIKYYPPSSPFSWRGSGSEYTILRGDTLGGISKKSYGTTRQWKAIWNNNRPLIKDPNLIFAGFMIYLPQNAGGVALR